MDFLAGGQKGGDIPLSAKEGRYPFLDRVPFKMSSLRSEAE